ncbi:MAG: ribose transport system permease protein [Thermoleophilaceae bacterium]|nr:ribose transport system permease protein [Thermoleophilaceae bacterium]
MRREWLVQGVERYAVVAVWGLMILFYSLVEPSEFATSGTFKTIFGSQAALVFLSMAFLCTVIVGEFVDLSVAAILGFCATLVPVLSVMHGWDVWAASAAAVAAGTAAGAINGLFVVGLGVNIIVVTLGISTLLTGIALAISHLHVVSGLSSGFSKIALTDVGGLPISFYYGIALVLIFAYVLGFTPLGRHMRFVGSNREVSRLAGVRVNRIRFGAFVMAGFLCGLGGVVITAGLGGYDPASSVTYLLPTVSAVFLGTAVIQPGRFNPIGTLVGVYFLATGILGLQELGYAGWISDVFYGAALIVAVTLSTVVRRQSTA